MRALVAGLMVLSMAAVGCGGDEKKGPSEGLEVGNRLPDVEYVDMYGVEGSIHGHRDNVVFINIAAGWCPPCQAETPGFQDVYEEFEPQGFVLLQAMFEDYNGLNPNQNFMETWRDTYGITFTLIPDTFDEFWDTLVPPSNTGYVPHNILIDQDGVITYTDYGGMSEASLRNKVTALYE